MLKLTPKACYPLKAFCKLAYKSFLTQSASIPCKRQEKWLADCNSCDFDTTDWGKSYTLAFLCSNESNLRVFQFKLLQRTISFLKLESNLMINAVSAKKARKLLHLFWECPFVKFFWNEISNWMKNSSCFLNEEFSFLSCIGLVNDTSNLLFHHALLIARYHICFSMANKKALTLHGNYFFELF